MMAGSSPPVRARIRAVPRRWAYPLISIVLAGGAPLGLVAVRWLTAGGEGRPALGAVLRDDPGTFLYVTLSTLIVFAAWGHLLGRQADALEQLSRTDPLTGLHNVRALEERLAEEVAAAFRYGAPLSVLVADVDRLKAINDEGGHRSGDEALRAVARALRADARQADLAARIGGDEFAVVAPNTDLAAGCRLAERVRERVATSGAGVTVSIGVAALGDHDADAEALLRAADAALYRAKSLGRNRVARGGEFGPARRTDA